MKNSKKAFTLVELLVVIAILAVLASVSIIGYTAFTKKAVENNAISELTQVKTLITSGTTADSNNEFVVFFGKEAPAAGNKAYKFSFDGGTNQYSYTELNLTSENLSTIELKISDEAKLAGTFDFTVANKISYSLTSGTNTANVTWDLAAGTVK